MSETNSNKTERIEELVILLNQASDAYYNGQDEIMSNYEWDALFDELTALEAETGYVRDDSPTQNTGFESTDGKREEHEFSALSLAKTKSVEELAKWAGELPIWLSWKLDGCTLVLTYDNGKLTKILTRTYCLPPRCRRCSFQSRGSARSPQGIPRIQVLRPTASRLHIDQDASKPCVRAERRRSRRLRRKQK